MKEFFEDHLPAALQIFEKMLKSSGGKYFAENKVNNNNNYIIRLDIFRDFTK